MTEIKKLLITDLDKVVQVHKDSFKNFFLTELGDQFLMVYYDSIRKDTKGILLGLFIDGELFGFCAATTLSNGFNKQLVLQNLFRFSLIGLRLLITKPNSLVRLIKNFSKNDSKISDTGEYAELLSIGVSSNKQGLGVGKMLLFQLENELKIKSCSELSLTTDYYKNDKTIQFYKGLGYNVLYEFNAFPERKMLRLIKKL